MTSENLIPIIEELAEVLQTQRTLGGTLANIAEVATDSVPRCDAASIALSINGRPATAATSARVALELDLVQYDLSDGPCLTSFRTMESLRLDVMELDEKFPHFAVASRKQGITGILSVPALWGDELVATLNLYSRTGRFDETAAGVAAVLAAQVAIAVSRSPEFAAARNVVEQAQRDVDDAADINMATGILMVNQACTAKQAGGLLAKAAEDDEQSILLIARRIIEQQRSSR